MKKIDPIMFSHAISHASDPGSSSNSGPSARMANALETRNSTEPTKSGTQTRWCVWVVVRFVAIANAVLALKASVPGNCVAAASQPRSCGSQARRTAGRRRRSSPSGAICGLWDCTSCENEALVKKIEPTKNVIASGRLRRR